MAAQVSRFVLFLLLAGSILPAQIFPACSQVVQKTDVFVGIDAAYGSIDEIKTLVDQVSPYTNLFVLGCTGITHNATKLNEACQYLYNRKMHFIVYQEWPLGYSRYANASINWPEYAKNKWGEQFLGMYYLDESGGKQLDQTPEWILVSSADNYSDAARIFDTKIDFSVNWFRTSYSTTTTFPVFTSDYALYWFDYKGGYDVLLAQFGWNYSRQLNIALCRGAATMQNRDWGVMVTWTYDEQPYLGNGAELYKDLVLAYDNGAKYIVVFDSNKEYTQGILKEDHFNALKEFWHYAQQNPRNSKPVQNRVAYALPEDYAYGFRGPEDKIWGLWQADKFSLQLSKTTYSLLSTYDSRLDIIYDEPETGNTSTYNPVLYWDSYTNSAASPLTLPIPSPIPPPKPTTSSNPTPSIGPLNSPFPTPPPTESQTAHPFPSISPQSTNNLVRPEGITIILVSVLVLAAVAVISAKTRRHNRGAENGN